MTDEELRGAGDFTPLYIEGRRDTRKRFVDATGNIVSYRQYIKLTQGVTPEEKAYRRYKEGVAPKGKTAAKVERRLEKKQKKKAKKERTIIDYPPEEDIPQKDMYKELKSRGKKPKKHNTWQLEGLYMFHNPRMREDATATAMGYSTHTDSRRKDMEFYILRRQAIENARAKLPFSGWEFVRVIWEQWLQW